MRTEPSFPLLYQANTRAWLTQIGRRLGRPATLDDLGDDALDPIAALGFGWVWMMGVWQTGGAGRQISRTNPDWVAEYRRTLPDLAEDDIAGSCFALTGYDTHADLGGDEALQRLRERLAARGLKLMLDYVPNHVAPDHPWTLLHPEWLIAGTEEDLERDPSSWLRIVGPGGSAVFAHGRDPYFPAWPDTLQLDWSQPGLQAAMQTELMRIAERCDGVRCDMAMLILPHVFRRTWNRDAPDFWPGAIAAVHDRYPEFRFLAEVYWDLEWELQQQGFDYTYDKRLYDRLRDGDSRGVREHLLADAGFQSRLARFIENHDEPRAASVFPRDRHEAAAVAALCSPGLHLIHQGQMHGRRAHVPTHLRRWPDEPLDEELAAFYARLLSALRSPAMRDGHWFRLEPRAAWEGNSSWDGFIAHAWRDGDGRIVLAVVNYAHHDGQCYLRLPFPELAHRPVRLRDLLGPAVYDRDGSALIAPGLYLDMPAWGRHAFVVETASAGRA